MQLQKIIHYPMAVITFRGAEISALHSALHSLSLLGHLDYDLVVETVRDLFGRLGTPAYAPDETLIDGLEVEYECTAGLLSQISKLTGRSFEGSLSEEQSLVISTLHKEIVAAYDTLIAALQSPPCGQA